MASNLTPARIPIAKTEPEKITDLLAACRSSASKLKAVLPLRPVVVLIEDDLQVARAFARILSPLVDVIVTSPAEALDYVKKHVVDLVLTDSIGLKVIPQIKKVAPDLNIVVISGGPKPATLPDGVALFLSKNEVDAKRLYALVESELDLSGLTMVD